MGIHVEHFLSLRHHQAHLCSRMCETCEIYGNFIALDILQNVQQKGCDIILLQICVFVRVAVVIAVANESIKGCVTFPHC